MNDLAGLMHVAASFGMRVERNGNGAICSTEEWRAVLNNAAQPNGDTWVVYQRGGGDHQAYGGATALELAGCLRHIGLSYNEGMAV